jgi:hypothetical protein
MSRDSGHLGGFTGRDVVDTGRFPVLSWSFHIPVTGAEQEHKPRAFVPLSHAQGLVVVVYISAADVNALASLDWDVGFVVAAANGTDADGLPIPYALSNAAWDTIIYTGVDQDYGTKFYKEMRPEGDALFGGSWDSNEFFMPAFKAEASLDTDLDVKILVYGNAKLWFDPSNNWTSATSARNLNSLNRDQYFEMIQIPDSP